MNKSEAAFRMSAGKLFDESEAVYFWTITFEDVHCDWQYGALWNRFWKDFTNRTKYHLAGLRVVEFHETHGVHFHLLCNRRLPVAQIRRIGKRWGIGRVHVLKADRGAIGYLCKYLEKDGRGQFHTQMRKWSAFGGFDAVRTRDIEVESDFAAQWKKVRGDVQAGYGDFLRTYRDYVRTGVVEPLSAGRQFRERKNAPTMMQKARGMRNAALKPLEFRPVARDLILSEAGVTEIKVYGRKCKRFATTGIYTV